MSAASHSGQTSQARSRIGDLSAAERNRGPIFEVMAPLLAKARCVLEIGSGDATHALFAQTRCPQLRWQVSETSDHLPRLVQGLSAGRGPAIAPPIALDVRLAWPAARWDAIYGANIAHIMTMDAVEALFRGAGQHLLPQGLLCLYGPFIEPDQRLGEGNRRFDAALKARQRGMGLRSVVDLDALASHNGLARLACYTMPSDNRLLVWQQQASVS